MELGIIAAPGLPAELAEGLATELPVRLAERFGGAPWRVTAERDALVASRADGVELVDAGRARLLDAGWDLAVCLTDQRPSIAGRPLTAEASIAHRVGAISVPRVGAERAREAVLDVVGELLVPGDRRGHAAEPARPKRRLEPAEPDQPAEPEPRPPATERAGPEQRPAATWRAESARRRLAAGRAALLIATLRANQPWRLTARLWRALAASLAAAAFGLVNAEVWRLSDALAWPRLAGLTLASTAATVVTLIAAHGLWERAAPASARERVRLFNLATALTVTIGVLALQVVLFLMALAAAGLLIDPDVLAAAIDHPARFGDYLALTWLGSSLAMIGGAVGAALESDRAVREAAYGYRRAA